MIGYCPEVIFALRKNALQYFYREKCVVHAIAFFLIFFVIIFYAFFPAPARAQGPGLHDPCGEGFGTCPLGMECVFQDGERTCLGGINFQTEDYRDCSPELAWEDGRCVVDYGQGVGGDIGLGSAQDIRDVIRKVIYIILSFVGIAGVVVVIYGGYLWMTAAGRDEQVVKAKKIILWGLAGLVVIALAWTITSFVLNVGRWLGGEGGGGSGAPPIGGGGFPSASVTYVFKINEIETGRPALSPPTQDVYLCSAVQAVFNTQIDAATVAAAEIAGTIKVQWDNAGAWQDHTAPIELWAVNGNVLTYEHYGFGGPGDADLFTANEDYRVLYPRTIEDSRALPLSGCDPAGCTVNPLEVEWRFKTGALTDSVEPDLQIYGTYPNYFNGVPPIVDPMYPSADVQSRPSIVIAFTEPILASSVINSVPPPPIPSANIEITRIVDSPSVPIGNIVVNNVDVRGPPDGLVTLPNNNFVAVLESTGGYSRLVIQLNPASLPLDPGAWYQISIQGVKDLCGNTMIGSKYWHFQVSGVKPALYETPPHGLNNVCFVNIEIGVISTASLYAATGGATGCIVDLDDTILGNDGYVTQGSLNPPTGRTLMVMDPYPGPPANPNNYCKQYFFDPASDILLQNQAYTVQVDTRYLLADGTYLKTNPAPWSFTTAPTEDQCVRPPILTSLAPSTGDEGQCVTLQGRNLDYFKDGALTNAGGKIESIGFNPPPPPPAPPPLNMDAFISAQPWRWSNTESVAKIPTGMALPNGVYEVREYINDPINSVQFYSNPVFYTLNNGAGVGACLEYISPNPTFRNELLSFHGSGFGAIAFRINYSGLAYVIGPLPEMWSETQIKSFIPYAANQGNVFVIPQAPLLPSNPRTLIIPNLEQLEVVERPVCSANRRISPSPYCDSLTWISESDVCIQGVEDLGGGVYDFSNARLNAFYEFKTQGGMPLTFSSQSPFVDGNNWIFVKCINPPICTLFAQGDLNKNDLNISNLSDPDNQGINLFLNNANIMKPDIAWWKFDDASGQNAQDSSGMNKASIFGATWKTQVDCKLGKCLEFNGANNYVCLDKNGTCDGTDANPNFDNPFTERSVALWFNAQDVIPRQILYEEGGITDGMNIFVSNGRVYAGAWAESATVPWNGDWVSSPILSNTWYHVAAEFNNNRVTIYLNGVAGPFTPVGVPMVTHGQDNAIGAMLDGTVMEDRIDRMGNGFYFKGRIDDVRVFSKALGVGGVSMLASMPIVEFDKGYSFMLRDNASVFVLRDDRYASPPAEFNTLNYPFLCTVHETLSAAQYANGECDKVDQVLLSVQPPFDPPAIPPPPPPAVDSTTQFPRGASAFSEAVNLQCQQIPGIDFNYSAEALSSNPPGAAVADYLELPIGGAPNPQPERIAIQTKNSTSSQAFATIQAGANVGYVHTPGTQILEVRNSGYCEGDPDCWFSNSCISTCNVATKQCNPAFDSANPVTPNNAGPAEWVTIKGCYFGVSPGQVDFNDGAPHLVSTFNFPGSMCENGWHDTYIITELPNGVAPGLLGPNPKGISITTSIGLSTALPLDTFTVNAATTLRPMLCGINPTSGNVNMPIKLYGKNLNIDAGTVQEAVFTDSFNVPTRTNATTTGNAINQVEIDATVPTGAINDWHDVALEEAGYPRSNTVLFRVGDVDNAAVVQFTPPDDVVPFCTAAEQAAPPPGREFCAYKNQAWFGGAGMATLKFNKPVKCTLLPPTANCFVIIDDESGNVYTVATVATAVPDVFSLSGDHQLGIQLVGPEPFRVGRRYTIQFLKNHLVTQANDKVVDCGGLVDLGARCEWTFTIQDEFMPKEVFVYPSLNPPVEDGIIIATPNHPFQDLIEDYFARVDDIMGNDISTKVVIDWYESNPLEIDLFPPVGPGTPTGQTASVQSIGGVDAHYQIFAKVDFIDPNTLLPKTIQKSANLEVQNDANLKVTDFHPGESVLETQSDVANVTITNGGNSLVDIGKAWAMNQLIGKVVIGDADGVYEQHNIVGNAATTLFIAGAWGLATGSYDYVIGSPVMQNICRNGVIDMTFNMSLLPSTVNSQNIKLFVEDQYECVIDATASIARGRESFWKRAWKKFASLFTVFKVHAQPLGYQECKEVKVEFIAPSRVLFAPKDPGKILYPDRNYQVRMYGYQERTQTNAEVIAYSHKANADLPCAPGDPRPFCLNYGQPYTGEIFVQFDQPIASLGPSYPYSFNFEACPDQIPGNCVQYLNPGNNVIYQLNSEKTRISILYPGGGGFKIGYQYTIKFYTDTTATPALITADNNNPVLCGPLTANPQDCSYTFTIQDNNTSSHLVGVSANGVMSNQGTFLQATSPAACGGLVNLQVDVPNRYCYYQFTSRKGAHGFAEAGSTNVKLKDDVLIKTLANYWVEAPLLKLNIIGGTNKGQQANITAYNALTDEVLFNPPLGASLDTTSEYVINNAGVCMLDHITIWHPQGPAGTSALIVNATSADAVILTAQGYSGKGYGQPIVPVTGFSWGFHDFSIHEQTYANIAAVPQPELFSGSIQLVPGALDDDGAGPLNDYRASVEGELIDENKEPNPAGDLEPGNANVLIDFTLDPNNVIEKAKKDIPVNPLLVRILPCSPPPGANPAQYLWEFHDDKTCALFNGNQAMCQVRPYCTWVGPACNSASMTGTLIDPPVNFQFSYCKQPSGAKSLLPDVSLSAVPVTGKTSRNVAKEYFLRYQTPATAGRDVFLMRVFKAGDYFVSKTEEKSPLEEWYKENEEILFEDIKGNFRMLANPIDGYDAAEVSRENGVNAVYVHLVNYADTLNGEDYDSVQPGNQSKVFSNVVVLAINQNASEITRQIFKELTSNWFFNSNVLTGGVRDEKTIDNLKDDFARIKDISFMGKVLQDYNIRNGGNYPAIKDGWAGGGIVTSVWGQEWGRVDDFNDKLKSLRAALNVKSLPVDPDDVQFLGKRGIEDAVKELADQCFACDQYVVGEEAECNDDPRCQWSVPLLRCEHENMENCVWGTSVPQSVLTHSVSRCFDPSLASDDFNNDFPIFSEKDFLNIGVGYGTTDETGSVIPSAKDIDEVFACYDDETREYYCRGENSPVYQYEVGGNLSTFTMFANLEYNSIIDAWCNGWNDELGCTTWTGGGVRMCEWFDPSLLVPNDEYCMKLDFPIAAQPRCSAAVDGAVKALLPNFPSCNFDKQLDCNATGTCEWWDGPDGNPGSGDESCRLKRDEASKTNSFNAKFVPL